MKSYCSHYRRVGRNPQGKKFAFGPQGRDMAGKQQNAQWTRGSEREREPKHNRALNRSLGEVLEEVSKKF